MKTFTHAEAFVCWAFDWFVDPELFTTLALLLIVLVGGGVAIFCAFHWYRTLKQTSSAGEALAQLTHALEDQDQLNPEEIERIGAAIERQQQAEPQAKPRKPGV